MVGVYYSESKIADEKVNKEIKKGSHYL
jgi:hypothetical protein